MDDRDSRAALERVKGRKRKVSREGAGGWRVGNGGRERHVWEREREGKGSMNIGFFMLGTASKMNY